MKKNMTIDEFYEKFKDVEELFPEKAEEQNTKSKIIESNNSIPTKETNLETEKINEIKEENSMPNKNIETQNTSNNEPNDNNLNDNKKTNKTIIKKKPVIISAIILLVILIIIGIGYYIFNNPKTLFLNSLNQLYTDSIDQYNKIKNNDLYSLAHKTTVLQTSQYTIAAAPLDPANASATATTNILNGMQFSEALGINYPTKNLTFDTQLQSNSVDILHINGTAQNKQLYFSLNNLYDKYISIPLGDSFDKIYDNTTNESALYVIKTIKNAYISCAKTKDFKTKNATIKIDNKNYNVNKITYTINADTYKKLQSDVKNKLLKDSQFINSYAKLTSLSIQDAKDKIKSFNKKLNKNDIITLSTYLDGKTTIKYEIDKTNKKDNNIIALEKSTNYINIIIKNKTQNISVAYRKISDTASKISLISQELTAVLDINKTNNNYIYKFNSTKGSDTITANGTYIKNTVIKNKQFDSTFTFNGICASNNINTLSFTINGISSTKIGATYLLPDTTNYINASDLKESDFNSIYTKFLSNEQIMKLFVIGYSA